MNNNKHYKTSVQKFCDIGFSIFKEGTSHVILTFTPTNCWTGVSDLNMYPTILILRFSQYYALICQ